MTPFFQARQLKANHEDWSDERLFNEARKWTIAVYQVIEIEIQNHLLSLIIHCLQKAEIKFEMLITSTQVMVYHWWKPCETLFHTRSR